MLHLESKYLLKKIPLTVTKNRLKILSYFLKKKKPISLKNINKKFKDFDRVTLFRILSVFEKHKLIHSIILENGKKLFALCKNECRESNHHDCKNSSNHVHFVCNECDDVSCLDIDVFPKIQSSNYIFSEININVSGICSKCI
ncbi:MAG: hypothetical protein CMD08_02505 [Flavobacteriales bacterium]|nr:hypothetical protein [Flavobacteriales bacterium]